MPQSSHCNNTRFINFFSQINLLHFRLAAVLQCSVTQAFEKPRQLEQNLCFKPKCFTLYKLNDLKGVNSSEFTLHFSFEAIYHLCLALGQN